MLRNKLFHWLSLSTLIIFALSALFTVPALTDSGNTSPSPRTAPSSSSSLSLQIPSGSKLAVSDSSGNKNPLGS